LREGEYKMGKEQIDPAFKYTDANIKKLKSETDVKVKKLEGELTKVAEGLLKETEMLQKTFDVLQASNLQTQRVLAKLQIRVIHNESISYEEAYSKAHAQFISEVTSAFIRVESSEQPLVIAEEFRAKRWEDLNELGVEALRIDH
jgi:hypothetical protein